MQETSNRILPKFLYLRNKESGFVRYKEQVIYIVKVFGMTSHFSSAILNFRDHSKNVYKLLRKRK